jgi:hypothetical protein
MKLYIVNFSNWIDRVYHPSNSGTISLELAKKFWPNAEVIYPWDYRYTWKFQQKKIELKGIKK